MGKKKNKTSSGLLRVWHLTEWHEWLLRLNRLNWWELLTDQEYGQHFGPVEKSLVPFLVTGQIGRWRWWRGTQIKLVSWLLGVSWGIKGYRVVRGGLRIWLRMKVRGPEWCNGVLVGFTLRKEVAETCVLGIVLFFGSYWFVMVSFGFDSLFFVIARYLFFWVKKKRTRLAKITSWNPPVF